MTETAKIELSNEEDTLERIALLYLSPMLSASFRAEVGRILKDSEKYQGIFTLSDDPASADKLFENLQARCDRYEKALTEIEGAVAEFADDDDYNFNFAGEIATKALAAIGGKNDGIRI